MTQEDERGVSVCEECGQRLLYGRHPGMKSAECPGTKCLRCQRLGLKGNPCIHDLMAVNVEKLHGNWIVREPS